MKKLGSVLTLKGSLAYNVITKIQLFDGRFDTGFKITDFQISPQQPTTSVEVVCKVSTDEPSSFTGAYWYWDSNEEIAWAGWGLPNGTYSGWYDTIDPDNLVVEDLYLQAYSSTGESQPLNYMIQLQKYEFPDWTGALAMVRNRSQG